MAPEKSRSEKAVTSKDPALATGRPSPFLWGVLYCLLVIFLFISPFFRCAFLETWEDMGPDWRIFFPAAEKMLEGKSPYPKDWLEGKPPALANSGWKDYIYPPLFARILAPLIPLGYFWSQKVYLAVCLAVTLSLLCPRFPQDKGSGWLNHFFLVGVFFGWGPLIQEFRHSQSDFIPLFLFLIAYRLTCRLPFPSGSGKHSRREILAGVLLGLAFNVKLTPALVFPLLIVTGRFRIAASFALSSMAVLLLSGPMTSFAYFTKILPTMLQDFSDMKGRPALHLGIGYLLDLAVAKAPDREVWMLYTHRLGVLLAGLLFLTVLGVMGRVRKDLSTGTVILIAFFLPPIFAGELSHHYLLTLPPFLVALHTLYRRLQQTRFKGWREWLYLGLVVLCLLPTFYYWKPAIHLCGWFETWHGILPAYQFVFGQVMAFLLVLPLFLRPSAQELIVPSLGFGAACEETFGQFRKGSDSDEGQKPVGGNDAILA